jgi:tetratricopeptide (TPR) repeat protein
MLLDYLRKRKERKATRAANAGISSLERRQYEEAISCFTRAIELAPNDPVLYQERYRARAGIEDDRAIADLQTAEALLIAENRRLAQISAALGAAYRR